MSVGMSSVRPFRRPTSRVTGERGSVLIALGWFVVDASGLAARFF
jgi:hypothetical protein